MSNAQRVFTLQSIKSRIETRLFFRILWNYPMFLLYSPLNQGLKPLNPMITGDVVQCFYSTVH